MGGHNSPAAIGSTWWHWIISNFNLNGDVFWLDRFLLQVNSCLFAECLVDGDFLSFNPILSARIRQISSDVRELNELFLVIILSLNLNVVDGHG